MPMAMATLPPELLRQSLSHLEHHDLAQTSLVCRKWLAPSRDAYWGSISVTLQDESARLLAPVLGDGTTVPRKIGSLTIDEAEDLEDRDEESGETAAWQAGLAKIMDHFETISTLAVSYLELNQFPVEMRRRVLRPDQVSKSLVVQRLKVEDPDEALSVVLDQPRAEFLGVGSIVLRKDDEENETKTDGSADGDGQGTEDNGEDGTGPEKDKDDTSAAVTFPDIPARLGKIRHLNIFSGPRGITWSHVVPLLAKASLTQLLTLIADCHDRGMFMRLVGAAAPRLRSLAVGFRGPGVDIDVSQATSLTNLSVSFSGYPSQEDFLADTITTISSAPPSVEHVFLNIGPEAVKSDKQLANSTAQWAQLDGVLASMPGLRQVTIIMVFDPCLQMFESLNRNSGSTTMLDKFVDEVVDFAKSNMPACYDRGLIEVKRVFGEWTSRAFAQYDLPD